ncbi:uncharacterized protein [Periplaneta americana]|uniref:uncharacterized protein n=1 Tax=Periplaneta americana TaxID=6978 RepID=UPI0037E77665
MQLNQVLVVCSVLALQGAGRVDAAADVGTRRPDVRTRAPNQDNTKKSQAGASPGLEPGASHFVPSAALVPTALYAHPAAFSGLGLEDICALHCACYTAPHLGGFPLIPLRHRGGPPLGNRVAFPADGRDIIHTRTPTHLLRDNVNIQYAPVRQ